MLGQLRDFIKGKPYGKRSPRWPAARAAHLVNHPVCSVCSGASSLEVHHIIPFHLDATKELDPSNLITLCESKKNGVNCHLFFGHLGNYKQVNTQVITACLYFKNMITREGEPCEKVLADR